MDGWIKIHRKLLDWEWYDDINVKTLFLHLLLTANYEPKNWHGIIIERGQLFTSLNNLAVETNLSVKQIRIALDKLKRTCEVDVKGHAKGILITLAKYDFYQCSDIEEGHAKGTQQGTQRATTKEYKNIINKNNNISNDILLQKDNPTPKTRFIKPTVQEINEYIQEKNYTVDAENFYDYYEANGWKVGRNAMKDWKATVRTWQKREKPNLDSKPKESDEERWKRFEERVKNGTTRF